MSESGPCGCEEALALRGALVEARRERDEWRRAVEDAHRRREAAEARAEVLARDNAQQRALLDALRARP